MSFPRTCGDGPVEVGTGRREWTFPPHVRGWDACDQTRMTVAGQRLHRLANLCELVEGPAPVQGRTRHGHRAGLARASPRAPPHDAAHTDRRRQHGRHLRRADRRLRDRGQPRGTDDPQVRGPVRRDALADLSAHRELPHGRLERPSPSGGSSPQSRPHVRNAVRRLVRGRRDRGGRTRAKPAADRTGRGCGRRRRVHAHDRREDARRAALGPRRPAASARAEPPPRRERPARGVREASLRALEIACTGWCNIHVAGRDDSHLRYGAFAQALLPDHDIEAPRETTRILGHLRPRGPTPRLV